MITLSFRESSSWNTKTDRSHLSEANEVSLRYDLFLGDIRFSINGVDFNCNWGWIPVIDFAASLLLIIRQLEDGECAEEFEFTESDARIHFVRQDDTVHLSTTFTKEAVLVSLAELSLAVREFVIETRDKLSTENPELLSNPAFNSLLPSKLDQKIRLGE